MLIVGKLFGVYVNFLYYLPNFSVNLKLLWIKKCIENNTQISCPFSHYWNRIIKADSKLLCCVRLSLPVFCEIPRTTLWDICYYPTSQLWKLRNWGSERIISYMLVEMQSCYLNPCSSDYKAHICFSFPLGSQGWGRGRGNMKGLVGTVLGELSTSVYDFQGHWSF